MREAGRHAGRGGDDRSPRGNDLGSLGGIGDAIVADPRWAAALLVERPDGLPTAIHRWVTARPGLVEHILHLQLRTTGERMRGGHHDYAGLTLKYQCGHVRMGGRLEEESDVDALDRRRIGAREVERLPPQLRARMLLAESLEHRCPAAQREPVKPDGEP